MQEHSLKRLNANANVYMCTLSCVWVYMSMSIATCGTLFISSNSASLSSMALYLSTCFEFSLHRFFLLPSDYLLKLWNVGAHSSFGSAETLQMALHFPWQRYAHEIQCDNMIIVRNVCACVRASVHLKEQRARTKWQCRRWMEIMW